MIVSIEVELEAKDLEAAERHIQAALDYLATMPWRCEAKCLMVHPGQVVFGAGIQLMDDFLYADPAVLAASLALAKRCKDNPPYVIEADTTMRKP